MGLLHDMVLTDSIEIRATADKIFTFLTYIFTTFIISTSISYSSDEIPTYAGSPPICVTYGQAGIPYNVGLHPGIDYKIPIGTPVIAVSEGKVTYIGEPYKDKSWGGGHGVGLKHGEQFFSVYGHLSKVYVIMDQRVIRGQLIGLSGKCNTNHPHLHFGLLKSDTKGSGIDFSRSYDPAMFWLGGESPLF